MQQQQVLEVKTSCHTCVPVYSTGIVSLKPVVTPCVPVCSAGIVCLKPVVTPVYLFAQQVLYVWNRLSLPVYLFAQQVLYVWNQLSHLCTCLLSRYCMFETGCHTCVPVCSAGIVCLKPVVTPVYLFTQQVLYVWNQLSLQCTCLLSRYCMLETSCHTCVPVSVTRN